MGFNNTTSVSAPPKFCSRDGMQLVDNATVLRMGFDPFTGIERPGRNHITRQCPTKGHDIWVLTDDGEWWVKP